MSEGQWMPMDSVPMDGTVVYVRVIQAMRFQPYKPNSEQFRKGIKGRWQRLTEYGGWDNCEAPTGEHWKMAESGEPVKYGCTHPRYGSTPECVLDDSSCATNAAGKIACFADSNEKCRTITDKAKCAHWRPIK